MTTEQKQHSTPLRVFLNNRKHPTGDDEQWRLASAALGSIEEKLEALQETLALTYGKLAHQMDEDLLARYDEQLPRPARIGDLFVSNPASEPKA